MTQLIGLAGRARSGKDTSANYLAQTLGWDTYAFADPIKDMLTPVFGHHFRSGNREEPFEWLGKSPRQLMQTLGTEWGRELIHPHLWILLANERLKVLRESGSGLIISDVRFQNEADWIRSEGGIVVEVRRPDLEKVQEHKSEQWEVDADVVIDNDGDLYTLRDKLRNRFEYLAPAAEGECSYA